MTRVKIPFIFSFVVHNRKTTFPGVQVYFPRRWLVVERHAPSRLFLELQVKFNAATSRSIMCQSQHSHRLSLVLLWWH